ncbi:winged helix-turn-helix domain-containing protein [Streptomyces cyaneofuscatus]|uniref:winged helix-turn-helix domain-containing protein n=1 Tax=Streptomyces cyaneofuscatus TaxID=66883 RepID=UPI0036644CAC
MLIGRKFHIGYSVSGATRLNRLGFSAQVSARRVAERDERAVAVWKEATWAEVKGRGRPAEAMFVSRTKAASPAGRPGDGRALTPDFEHVYAAWGRVVAAGWRVFS